LGDLENKTATLAKSAHRQLRPMASSLNRRLIFPDGSAVRTTLEGRRKRLRDLFQPPAG
jgi:hypothetical protein